MPLLCFVLRRSTVARRRIESGQLEAVDRGRSDCSGPTFTVAQEPAAPGDGEQQFAQNGFSCARIISFASAR